MERKPIIGISFKNYINTRSQISDFLHYLKRKCKDINDIDIFIFPSMGTIETASEILRGSNICFGVQNIAPIQSGAMTGEFSIESLIDIGGEFVELGHYERIRYLNEDDNLINQKLNLALKNKRTAVLCVGEAKQNEQELRTNLSNQLNSYLDGIRKTDMHNIIFAYEPVWAIGKTESASVEHIEKAIILIRNILEEKFGKDISEQVRVIYGGSVSVESVKSITESKFVDGVFVGRFGHKPESFLDMVEIVRENKNGWRSYSYNFS